MKFFVLTTLMILVSFVIQEFVPVSDWAFFSRLLIVHCVFYTIAVAVPFPAMLTFAFLTGFLWDARYHIPMTPPTADVNMLAQTELPFGFSILVFGVLGALIQGVRPLFRRGRWELPILMIGLCTSIGLLFEYLLLSFHRGGLEVSSEFWWKLGMTGLFSALISPLLLLLLRHMALRAHYRIRIEGLKRRHTYDGDAL